jgi:hypothetical protein
MYDAGHFLPSSHEDKLLQDLAPILTNAAANSTRPARDKGGLTGVPAI